MVIIFWHGVQVCSIRDAAADNLKRLAEEFGPEWAMQHIIPQVCPTASMLLSYFLLIVDCFVLLKLFLPG